MSSSQPHMISWVTTELLTRGVDEGLVKAVGLVLGYPSGETMTAISLSDSLLRLDGDLDLPTRDGVAMLAVELRSKFERLKEVMDLRWIARLQEDLLRDADLDDYILAARAGEKRARRFLEYLTFLQGEPEESATSPFVCVIASSGTGKTQLAATAALTYSTEVTTIYLNVGVYESSEPNLQRFYRPHACRGLDLLLNELASFKDVNHLNNSTAIQRWAEKQDDGTTGFVHMLYFLLLVEEEPVVGLQNKSTVTGEANTRIKLTTLKEKIRAREKKFLLFLDAVPELSNPTFHLIVCLRDCLRYLGIAPILMSTHPGTGAQSYVVVTSRNSSGRLSTSTWTTILGVLPTYSPTPTGPGNRSFLKQSERPLVLQSAINTIERNDSASLSIIVNTIRRKLQIAKPQAWRLSPALQLVQLFCTDIDINKKDFTIAHNVVGHHFGSLDQNIGDDNRNSIGAKSYNTAAAAAFGDHLSVAPVSAKYEPLLYLSLVTWDETMLSPDSKLMFPLIDSNGRPLTVRGAFNRCSHVFEPRVNNANADAQKLDGDLLEVLVHASLTLASMRMKSEGKWLPGVPLLEFVALVRHRMLSGSDYLDALPSPSPFLENIRLVWGRTLVPALSGCGSTLPTEIAMDTNSLFGFRDRPADQARVDGYISNMNPSGGKCDNPFISIACKNYADGVTADVLKGVFKRIKKCIQCSLIFVSSFDGEVFSDSELTKVKNECFSAHDVDSVTVVSWGEGSGDHPTFLKIGGMEFKASATTNLLVVILRVGAVYPNKKWGVHRDKKRKKWPAVANLPLESSQESRC